MRMHIGKCKQCLELGNQNVIKARRCTPHGKADGEQNELKERNFAEVAVTFLKRAVFDQSPAGVGYGFILEMMRRCIHTHSLIPLR